MSANLPILWADKKNRSELQAFLVQFGIEYYLTAEEINQLRDAVNEMSVIQQSTYLGTIEPASTPTGVGNRYWTAVTPGTYTNFGGVVVLANSLAIISASASNVFSVSQTLLDLGSIIGPEGPPGAPGADGSTGAIESPFSQVISFNERLIVSNHTQTADIVFTKNETGKILMGATYMRIIADGTHTIDFSAFKKQSGSGIFKNVNGFLNVCCFWYDGVDYWVNIWQDIILFPPHVFAEGLTTFSTFYSAVQNATTKIITGNISQGAYTLPIEFYDGAEIWSENSADGSILGITLNNDNLFVWANASNLRLGIYQFSGVTYASRQSTAGVNSVPANVGNISGSFVYKKIRRSGNSLIASVSSNGTTWTDFYSENNVFSTENPTVYIKAQFTVNGGTMKPNQKI